MSLSTNFENGTDIRSLPLPDLQKLVRVGAMASTAYAEGKDYDRLVGKVVDLQTLPEYKQKKTKKRSET